MAKITKYLEENKKKLLVYDVLTVVPNVLYTGAVPEEGCGRAVFVSKHAEIHLRVRVLPQEEQPVSHIWGTLWGLPFYSILLIQ